MHKLLSATLVAALLVACGGETPPPKVVEAPPPPKAVHTAPEMRSSQELGSIDEAATKKTWQRLSDKLLGCISQGSSRLEYLSGEVKFFLRIGQDGRVRYGWLERSSLGDRETEKCLLDVAKSASWPQPEGGEAEVRYDGLGFDPAGGVRMPTEWPSDKVAATVGKHHDSLARCLDGVGDTKFRVTAYIEPGGKVQAVGVSTSSKEGAEKIDCIVSAVHAMKMPNPGSYAAKVAFQL